MIAPSLRLISNAGSNLHRARHNTVIKTIATYESPPSEPILPRIEIADDHRSPIAPFQIGELPGLATSDSFCIIRAEVIYEIQIRLHVRIDESDARTTGVYEIYAKPAFRDEGIKTRRSDEGIEAGILEVESAGWPREGEAGAEYRGKMPLSGGSEEYPAVCGEGSGPFGVHNPRLLECGDVTVFDDPGHDLFNGHGNPGEAVHIIRYDA